MILVIVRFRGRRDLRERLFGAAAGGAFRAHRLTPIIGAAILARTVRHDRLPALLADGNRRHFQSKMSGAAALVGTCTSMARQTHKNGDRENGPRLR